MQKYNQFSKQLEPFLLKSSGQMTASDASSLTGLSIEQSKDALAGLASKYICKLKVTENGDLIYDFGKFIPIGKRSWAEFFNVVANTFWKVFKTFYKIWIAVTLVVYFIVFLTLVVAILLSSSSSKKGRKNSGHNSFELIFSLWRAIFWTEQISSTRRITDSFGYAYRIADRPNKNFINSVYDFVFGPPRPAPASLGQEKEFASFLHQNKGIATISDIIAISGMSREKASEFFSLSLINFEGEAKIDEKYGVLYGDYSVLLRSADGSQQKKAEVVYYWDEFEAPIELTGNSVSRNASIALMNGFNLICGLFFVGFSQEVGLQIILGIIPFAFSVIFFAIPVFRYIGLEKRRMQLNKANIRRALMKAIFKNRSSRLTAEEFLTLAYGAKPPKNASKIFNELCAELEAESEPTEQGLCYYFESIDRELSFAENFRIKHRVDASLGRIELESL